MNYIIRNVKNAKYWNGVGWVKGADDASTFTQGEVHFEMKRLREKGERVTFEVVGSKNKTWR